MYPHQAERLTEALDRGALDALVATSPASVAYVTGFHGYSPATFPPPDLGVFTRAGTALVTAAATAPAIVSDGVDADHVVVFGALNRSATGETSGREARRLNEIAAESSRDQAGALAVALDRLGVGRGSVGLEETWLPPEVFRVFAERLTGAKITGAAASLGAARRVKGPYEIECLGRSLQIAEESLDAVIQAIERGTTEHEAATLFCTEVLKRGGWPFPPLVGMGDRTAIPAPRPTDAGLRAGALVRFDVGCIHKGYCSAVARTAILGEPSARVEAAYHAVQTGLEEAIGAVAAGASTGRAFDAAVEAMRTAGLSTYSWDRIGHGIGLDRKEAPGLDAGGEILEAGEVLCIETSHYEVGDFGVGARDTVLVTKAGGRPLNRSHHGLVILD